MCELCNSCAARAQPEFGVLPQAEQEPREVWVLARFDHDYDFVEEAARAKKMTVSEFVAFAAAEYADLYLNAYEAAMQDLADKIKGGGHV